tara:strand:+ start:2035 stop:2364 length:330 start_codon:yes stop_codon:yes gene_type:complete
MYIAQIVKEDINEIKTELISLLDAISVEGIQEIQTASLLKDMRRSGHTISKQQLLGLLQEMPIVKDANIETIRVVTDRDNDVNIGNGEDDIDKAVGKLAQKQVDKEIGS